MTPIATVAALGALCAIGQHLAHVRFHDDLARLLTFAAAVLMGAAFVAGVAEVAL